MPGEYCLKRLCHLLKLIGYLVIASVIVVLWQPVTAFIKFFRDGMFESSSGEDKVKRLKQRRYDDLTASRADLVETSIEATFEPLIIGYIIFPSIISLATRINESIAMKDGKLNIGLEIDTLQLVELWSIISSILSLAWCYSDLTSTKKHLQLDITISPVSRILMCIWMILQMTARLLAFMLFAVYWGPGCIYPLMIFAAVHTVLGGILHVVFSEDMAFWRKGTFINYLKFFQNVILNSFATLYFHNYLRFDEMPNDKLLQIAGTKVIL